LIGDGPTVETRHHHVEQDDVRRRLSRRRKPAQPIDGFYDLKPLCLEVDAIQQAERRFIIDDENPRHLQSTLARRGGRAPASFAPAERAFEIDDGGAENR